MGCHWKVSWIVIYRSIFQLDLRCLEISIFFLNFLICCYLTLKNIYLGHNIYTEFTLDNRIQHIEKNYRERITTGGQQLQSNRERSDIGSWMQLSVILHQNMWKICCVLRRWTNSIKRNMSVKMFRLPKQYCALR